MKPITAFVCLLLFVSANCKKDTSNPLPPETHTGAFTFGCKIDGKVYTAIGQGAGLIGFDHNYYIFHPDSSIDIGAGSVDESKNKFSINFTIKYSGNLGTYSMKSYPYQGTFTDQSNGTIPGSDNTYTTTDTDTGTITITYFDGGFTPFMEGSVLAGTFQMDAINGEGKVIHITDGRFDIGQ